MVITFEHIINDFEPKNNYEVLLGYDKNNQLYSHNFLKNGNLLIAGQTGSGKSVLLHQIVLSLMLNHSPDLLKLFIHDPKRVEFHDYQISPFVESITTNNNDFFQVINKLHNEMNRRFNLIKEYNYKDINEFNNNAYKNNLNKLPFNIVLIDEYADIMNYNNNIDEIEDYLKNLLIYGQKAGILFIISTQYLNNRILSKQLKNIITSRVSMKVFDQIQSENIIDEQGAEKLYKPGSMIYKLNTNKELIYLQSVFISNYDINQFNNYFKEKYQKIEA